MKTKTKTKSVAAHKKVAKRKYRTAKTRIAKVADSVRPGRPPLPLNKLKVRVSYTLAPKIQKPYAGRLVKSGGHKLAY